MHIRKYMMTKSIYPMAKKVYGFGPNVFLIHSITFLKSLPPYIYDFKRPTHFIEELSPKGLTM
jgi:hypothetical protein